MRQVQLLGILFHISNEFLDVIWRKIFSSHDQDRLLHDQPDRLEVGVRLVGEVGIKRYRNCVGSQMPDLDGVTIRTGAHSPQRTGGAAGACDILHDNLLPERARHMIADDPGRDVARTPSRERRDHLDGPRRPRLCSCDLRDGGQRDCARGHAQESASWKFHFHHRFSPWGERAMKGPDDGSYDEFTSPAIGTTTAAESPARRRKSKRFTFTTNPPFRLWQDVAQRVGRNRFIAPLVAQCPQYRVGPRDKAIAPYTRSPQFGPAQPIEVCLDS